MTFLAIRRFSCFSIFCLPQISFTNSALPAMAFSRICHNDRGELRVYESLDDLTTNLAEYIAELSEASVKDHGVFSVALSGGSLISLMGYCSQSSSFCDSTFDCNIGCSVNLVFSPPTAAGETGSSVKLPMTGLWIGLNGIFFGRMSVWYQNPIPTATTSWQKMCFCLRCSQQS